MSARKMSRRTFVAATTAAAATSAFPLTAVAARKRRRPLLRTGTFDCGVASGFPGTSEITLWTHVADVGGDGYVALELAADPDFRHTIKRVDVRAAPVRDHTARTHLTGLNPGEQYHYRFATHHTHSPVGRFRTLRPADSTDPVRIAYFSCQDYQAGYYPSHADIAADDDIDLVVCLGDYIYEQTYYKGPRSGKDRTGGTFMTDDPAYVVTHDEFRAKYRLYKSDPQLQAMHAAHPYISIWDDHEVEDNYAGDKRDPAKTDVLPYDFGARRRNGYLAWFEYMPRIRPSSTDTKIYGSVPISQNVELFLTDERQYRDQQPCDDRLALPCPDANAPGRTFLGAAQKQWFKDAVVASKATWKLVANELMIMSVDSVPGQALNLDSWDGYGAERQEILSHFAAAGVKNLSFLTGDIHSFFAGTVTTTGRIGGTPVGTEFVGGSITSLGFESIFGPTAPAIQAALPAANPHFAYVDLRRRGYAVLTASPDALQVEYRSPASNDSPTSPVSTSAAFRVASGSTRVQRVK